MSKPAPNVELSRFLLLLMTTAIAATAANLYYNQPILPLLSTAFNLSDAELGSIPALTQFGYAFALLFISPLGDSVQRKKIITTLSLLLIVACLAAALATNLTTLLVSVFLIGVAANITQQLIPFAASLVSVKNKGATLGTLMMGLTLGILLSRTVSGFVGEHFGWQSVFYMSAVLAAFFGGLLYMFLPSNKPHSNLNYFELIKSSLLLLKQHKQLRLFTLSGAFWFASFNALWATLAIYVSDEPFSYGAEQAGLFGIIALAGVIGAKLAGRFVNKLGAKNVIWLSLSLIAIGFLITGAFGSNLSALVIGIILIDFGVFSAQVSNQVRVFSLDIKAQSRINGIYMLGYYLGGALGSFSAVKAFDLFNWQGVVTISLAFIFISALFNALAKKVK